LGPGPDDFGQKCVNLPTYDIIDKKNKIRNFPIFKIQTRRLATSFEGLNPALQLN